MKRVLACVGTVGLLMVGVGGTAAAVTPNDHNCAGVIVSGVAGPGFGQVVAGAAHARLVDNVGLADCGQTNRNNP